MENFRFKVGETPLILDNLSVAIMRITLDEPELFIDVNTHFLTLFGYSSLAEIGAMPFLELCEDSKEIKGIRQELNQEGMIQAREIFLKRKNGTSFEGRITIAQVKDEAGRVLYADGIIEYLSEVKSESQALQDIKQRLELCETALIEERQMFSQGPVIQIHWPLSDHEPLIYISDNVFDILGYRAEAFTQGKIFYADLVHKEDRAELQEHIRIILAEGADVVHVNPYRLEHKDGSYIWVQDYGYVKKNQDGIPIGTIGYIYDVTKQYLAASEKRELEQTQLEERNIFMAGPIIVLKWDVSAGKPLIRVSENVHNILGYTVEELIRGDVLFEDIIHPDDIKRVRSTAKEAIKAGLDAFDTTAYRIKKKDGSYLWMNDHSTIVRDESGQVKSISGLVYDMSSTFQAKAKLKEKEQTYRSLFNSISEAIFIQDPVTYEILDVNETMLKMYGYERAEVLGTTVQKFSYEEQDKVQLAELLELVKQEGQQTLEWHAKHKSGKGFWVEVKVYLATIDGELKILANVRDISNRKNLLVKLKQSLQEQELLLREVHHRVKNNMQVIISLLNLQAEYTQSDELFEIFGETQNRIRTMALIHEKLFRSSSMASVDFSDYINSLVSNLNSFYDISSRQIKTHLDLKKIDLNINKAIPCGLIINELITNALKYAFPNNREGDIWVSIRDRGDSSAEVSVKDNGVGIDPNLNYETTLTMGLRIVRILAEQLNGEMTISSKQGTQFSLTFMLHDEE